MFRISIMFILFAVIISFSYEGTIVDLKGNAIHNSIVKIKGSSKFVSTDKNGQFVIESKIESNMQRISPYKMGSYIYFTNLKPEQHLQLFIYTIAGKKV
ncbi:MAG: hypothetical protein JNL74_24270, partial [Fibrobacteres bacterium]|nr:hypothetical protein [Fibrobacterota bacterium]